MSSQKHRQITPDSSGICLCCIKKSQQLLKHLYLDKDSTEIERFLAEHPDVIVDPEQTHTFASSVPSSSTLPSIEPLHSMHFENDDTQTLQLTEQLENRTMFPFSFNEYP